MTDKKKNPIWDILRSVKLTLFILSVLAAASIIGTLIQQEDTGIYYSLWFRFIIFCLAVNLIVCSIDRLPVTLKIFRHTPNPDRPKLFEEAEPRTLLFPNASVGAVSSIVQGILRSRFKNLAVKEHDNSSYIYCEKGRYSLFSVYLVHLSVLLILAGAIAGSIFGFSGYVNIPEGRSIDSVVITSGKDRGNKELGFVVRCEKFLIELYDSGEPKEYRSDLSFIENGKESLKGALRVNHPVKFKGIRFYQSSYGDMPGETVRIKALNSEKGEETTIEVGLGKAVTLPDNRGELTLSDIRDNLMNMLGPAVLITIKSPEGKETPIWVLKDRDTIKKKFSDMFELSQKFNPSAYAPFTFELYEMSSVTYTGLQVARDPGVPFVFAGFIMIIIGLFLTFFTSHRRFWIRISDEKGDVKVSLAGTSHKNPVGMERALDVLLSRLKETAMEGKHND